MVEPTPEMNYFQEQRSEVGEEITSNHPPIHHDTSIHTLLKLTIGSWSPVE